MKSCLLAFLAFVACAIWYACGMRRVRDNGGAFAVFVFSMLCAVFLLWAGVKHHVLQSAGYMPLPMPQAECMAGTAALEPLDGTVPEIYDANLSVFERPADAFTPEFWQHHSACRSCQPATAGYVAGICGAVSTTPCGFDDPEEIDSAYNVYAPFSATNSFLLGTSDFWVATNDISKTFVWKDVAFNRDPSNLASFAAKIYEWGDVEYTYGGIPPDGFKSFLHRDGEYLDLTAYCASGKTVRLEKEFLQTDAWWLENYPEICSTNDSGELVFDYDTNEWCTVEFRVLAEDGDEAEVAGGPYRTFAVGTGNKGHTINVFVTSAQSTIKVEKMREKGDTFRPLWTCSNKKIKQDFTLAFETGVEYRVWVQPREGTPMCSISKIEEVGEKILEITRISNTEYRLVRPIKMSFETEKEKDADWEKITARLSPSISGGDYYWSCTGDVKIVSTRTNIVDVWRGKNGGTVFCDWRKGAARTRGSCVVSGMPQDQTPLVRYFSLEAERNVAYFEPPHRDENGVLSAATKPVARLSASFGGNGSGRATLRAPDGLADGWRVYRDGEEIDLPYEFSISKELPVQFEVRAEAESQNASGTVFSADFHTDGGGTITDSTSVTFVKVEVASFGEPELRRVFGPTERVVVSAMPEPPESTDGIFGPFYAATNAVLALDYPCGKLEIPVSIIAPSGVRAENLRVLDEKTLPESVDFQIPQPGWIGAAFVVDLRCQPEYVSFKDVVLTEGVASPQNVTGYFTHTDMAGVHGTKNGAGVSLKVGPGNYAGEDHVGYSTDNYPQPFTSGSYFWDIPVTWSISGHADPQIFTTNRETFAISSEGTFTIGKFGCFAERGTNNITTVIVPGNSP